MQIRPLKILLAICLLPLFFPLVLHPHLLTPLSVSLLSGASGQYPLVQNLTVTEGGTANLTCRVEYNDNTSLQWSNPAQQTLFFGDKKGERESALCHLCSVQDFVSLYMQERKVEFSFINIASVKIKMGGQILTCRCSNYTGCSELKLSGTVDPKNIKTTQQ